MKTAITCGFLVLAIASWAKGAEVAAAAGASNPTPTWELLPSRATLPDGFNFRVADEGRTLVVAEHGESRIELGGLAVEASRAGWLYILLELPSPAQLRVFYRKIGTADFDDESMALVAPPTYLAGPHAYQLDMRTMPGWSERIEGLRICFDGLMAGATVRYGGVAGSAETLPEIASHGDHWPSTSVSAHAPYKAERFVACSRTVVSLEEATAAAGLSTYIENPRAVNPFGLNFDPQSQFGLAQFTAGIGVGDGRRTYQDASVIRVAPRPGTLLAQMTLPDDELHVQITPLRPLSDTDRAEGAVLYRVRSVRGAPVWMSCGQMAPMTVWERGLWLRTGKPPKAAGSARVEGTVGLLSHADVPYTVALRAGPGASTPHVAASGSAVEVEFASGEGWVVAAFAPGQARAAELTGVEALKAEQESLSHFENVLGHFRIATPNPVLDEAFRTAWLNMDYSWVRPFGCTESLHHWWAIWQQYPSASFDWAGLADRTRASILSHATRQYRSGNVPYLLYFGERHSDFGGNNQTFMWQVQHYLLSTGDKELAGEILPMMRRLVDAFWRYEDLDNNLVPGFGVQVLTQEDYIATPRDGTSSAVVGVEMWRTLALVERMAGNAEKAAACEARAREAARRWRERLWLSDLGRPAYFTDQRDQVRPDGPYHTLVLPVVYGLLNPLEAYSSVRHMTDRLVGPQGELYYSNNFPNHISGARSSPFSPTWGMQAGAYMQPWAAWAYNRIGARNDAIRPLEVVARWATMSPHRDAWPESSTELTPAYFSNTAANYAQSVIEALFGLQLDCPANMLHIQPAFPDDWEKAEICLSSVRASYERHGNSFRYHVHSTQPMPRRLRWPLPVCTVEKVTVNAVPCSFTTEEAVGGIWLTLTTEPLADTDITFSMTPIAWTASHPRSLAEGETMDVRMEGCRIVAVEDPSHLAVETSLRTDGASLRLAEAPNTRWLRFGRLGQLNFSRRTIFLRCEARGQTFFAPLDFTILPRFEAAPAGDVLPEDDGYAVQVLIRNNSARPLEGAGRVHWGGAEKAMQLAVPPRSEVVYRVGTGPDELAHLTPGDNRLRLILPSGDELQLACPVARPFQDHPKTMLAASVPIPLPDDQLITDETWQEFAAFPVFWQGPYNSLPRPMDAIRAQNSVSCDGIPGITFPIADGGRIAVASRRLGRPTVTVDVGRALRKIYLLVLPFVENHDVFTDCALATVTCRADTDQTPFDPADEPVQWTRARYGRLLIQRRLCTPGDLDSWLPEYHVGPMSTSRLTRPDRYGLLSRLGTNDADWPEGLPLAGPYGMFAMLEEPPRDKWPEGTFRSFPQPQYWASCPVIRTPSATLNVVEIDLARPRDVLNITLECPLQDAAIALVSAVGL